MIQKAKNQLNPTTDITSKCFESSLHEWEGKFEEEFKSRFGNTKQFAARSIYFEQIKGELNAMIDRVLPTHEEFKKITDAIIRKHTAHENALSTAALSVMG